MYVFRHQVEEMLECIFNPKNKMLIKIRKKKSLLCKRVLFLWPTIKFKDLKLLQ